MMCRTLQHLKLRRKKSLHDSQRDTPRVQALRRDFSEQIQPALTDVLTHLKFIDEMGVHLGLTRLYGRATPGERVSEGTPDYRVALHHDCGNRFVGCGSALAVRGAMTTLAFETYLQCELIPTLRRGDIVLLDNLSAHKSAEAQRLIEARGAQAPVPAALFVDFNPIELCWSKVKAALRTAKARTFDALLEALAAALRSVSPGDVEIWFAHCGYARS